MIILGIETSCDETAAAVIKGERGKVKLLSNTIVSSLSLHGETGGIIPEQAAREQIKYILPVIQESLQNASISLNDVDALALTFGPGLIGSLLVGVETVKTIAFTLKKPIIPVNHMIGHIYANWINKHETIPFPAIGLVVSGGHTDLLLLKDHGKYSVLGGTRDDAAGECFDKCARLLGFAYPGGPHIAKLAELGDPTVFKFPRPMIGSHDYDFSFSGLKTAFLNMTKQHFPLLRTTLPNTSCGWEQILIDDPDNKFDKQIIYNLCAALQQAIVDVLAKKTIKAALAYNTKTLLLSGGVAANKLLCQTFLNESEKHALQIFLPDKSLCTDNAAMIATAAYYNFQPQDWHSITANPELYY